MFKSQLLRAYRNEVWLVMHSRNSPEDETAALRLYLDESGGDDPGTPHAVVGGMLISRARFFAFEAAWDRMLKKHGLTPPLHMKEFGRPHGRFASLSDRQRKRLFAQAVKIIQLHRVGSISASLSNKEYRHQMPSGVADVFGVYGMCFVLAAFVTQVVAAANFYDQRIPIIMDSGNPYANHVRESHATIQLLQKQESVFQNIGSLTFDDDENLGILQAADVIAWGARRRATGLSFNQGFAPINAIFANPNRHKEAAWMQPWLVQLGEHLSQAIIREKQKRGV